MLTIHYKNNIQFNKHGHNLVKRRALDEKKKEREGRKNERRGKGGKREKGKREIKKGEDKNNKKDV